MQESKSLGISAPTKSLSPLTLQIIPARVVEENNAIYLEKIDEAGKYYKTVIENDRKAYHLSLGNNQNLKGDFYYHILNISSKCNLNCLYCYTANNKQDEISTSEIINIGKRYRNKVFVLGGQEPTCRSDLPKIINIIARYNYPCLATNGIKLMNLSYLKNLKAAGLKHIFFSLNALDEDILYQMHGQHVLAEKLRALDNIKQLRIPTIISTSILRGMNEDQIPKIFHFCLNKGEFIYELRIRNMFPFPNQIMQKAYCISELIHLTCRQLGLDSENLQYEYRLFDELNRYLKIKAIARKSCSSFFHIKRMPDRQIIMLGQLIKGFGNNLWHQWWLYSSLLAGLSRKFLLNLFRKSSPYVLPGFFKLSFRVWPNVYNIDLGELERKCSTCYHENENEIAFCLWNIYHSYYSDLQKPQRQSQIYCRDY